MSTRDQRKPTDSGLIDDTGTWPGLDDTPYSAEEEREMEEPERLAKKEPAAATPEAASR